LSRPVLSRRCPPSSFVAAQRAVHRQGRRVERPLCRSVVHHFSRVGQSHSHQSVPLDKCAESFTYIVVKMQPLCCSYIRFIFLLDRCASNAPADKRHHGSGWAVHMSRAPGSLDFWLHGSTRSLAMAPELVAWRAGARWWWCHTGQCHINRQANNVVSVLVHACFALHAAVWYIIN
jgi:hypothetical protein